MTTDYPLSVRYVLYSHYPEGNDFNHHLKEGTPPHKLEGVQYLVGHLKGLSGLLTWPGYEGLLVLFYAPGLADCLDGIGKGDSEIDLVRSCPSLKFARAVETYLQALVKKEYKELESRLRFITALDLHKVFGRVGKNSKIAQSLRSWMVGDVEGIRYDSPKIVEAIVRLRLLGSDVPVFRVDYDVLFRGDGNWGKKNLEFSSTIGSCLTAYQKKRDSNRSSFIFSASYDHKALLNSDESNKFHPWGRAFATRVFPALLVNEELMNETIEAIKEGESDADAWDNYAAKSFSQDVARKFFGFDSESFKTSEVKGIGKIGAHPMASVISGAMLYLSDGAILDLPPFSNFQLNVSWIDDHLKYCLHRELRHLSRIKLRIDASRIRPDTLLTYSKLDDVIVQKAGRKIPKDLRNYILDEYLPTLLRGTIMDAWITHEPLLKYRPEDLSEENRDVWSRIPREKQSNAVLPSALQQALEECNFGRKEKHNLKLKLKEVALQRINEVRRQWRELTEDGLETFASIWAKGEARSRFPNLNLQYSGIANPAVVPVDKDVPDQRDLDGHVQQDLNDLVDNAIEYIDWTLNWPAIVQVVRSIEQGSLRTDLNFNPEREDRT
jgi:hypothetical protein